MPSQTRSQNIQTSITNAEAQIALYNEKAAQEHRASNLHRLKNFNRSPEQKAISILYKTTLPKLKKDKAKYEAEEKGFQRERENKEREEQQMHQPEENQPNGQPNGKAGDSGEAAAEELHQPKENQTNGKVATSSGEAGVGVGAIDLTIPMTKVGVNSLPLEEPAPSTAPALKPAPEPASQSNNFSTEPEDTPSPEPETTEPEATDTAAAIVNEEPITVSSEPWDTPVCGLELANTLSIEIGKRLSVEEHVPDLITLYTFATFKHRNFIKFPYCNVTSDGPGSGKSELLRMFLCFCFRPYKADSMNAANAYRLMNEYRPMTMVLDEVDSFLKNNGDLRGILNSCHDILGGVPKQEADPETGVFRTVKFLTYGPLILGGIGKIPTTLYDRSIVIHCVPMNEGEELAAYPLLPDDPFCFDYRRKLTRWSNDWDLGADGSVRKRGSARVNDLWFPLEFVAEHLGGDWPQRCQAARTAALLTKAGGDLPERDLILHDLKTIRKRFDIGHLHTATIVDQLFDENIEHYSPVWQEKYRAETFRPVLAKLLSSYRNAENKPVKPKSIKAFLIEWKPIVNADGKAPPKTEPQKGWVQQIGPAKTHKINRNGYRDEDLTYIITKYCKD